MIYTPSIYGPLLFGFPFFFGWQWHHSQTARKRTTKWRRRGEKPLEMGDFDGDGDGCCTVPSFTYKCYNNIHSIPPMSAKEGRGWEYSQN